MLWYVLFSVTVALLIGEVWRWWNRCAQHYRRWRWEREEATLNPKAFARRCAAALSAYDIDDEDKMINVLENLEYASEDFKKEVIWELDRMRLIKGYL